MNSIRNLRKRLRMTQSEFAEFCDLSIVSISRYESGENISRKSAEKIARVCNVPIDFVLNNPDEHDPENGQKYIYMSLSPEETDLLADFRSLEERGKRRVKEFIGDMTLLYGSEK